MIINVNTCDRYGDIKETCPPDIVKSITRLYCEAATQFLDTQSTALVYGNPASDARPKIKGMAPQASTVDASNLFIPLIDFALFRHGTPEERARTAWSILHGFQRVGFIYLRNFPIPMPVIEKAFDESAAFFRRPQVEKDNLAWTTPESNRGYVTHGREKVSFLTDKEEIEALKVQMPDLKESFEIGREDVEGHPNVWPSSDDAAHDFRANMIEFFAQCKELHIEVMRAIAVGMGLEESYFDPYTDGGDNTLRLLHYPEVPKSVFAQNKQQVRAGAHTDYGSITLLFQDKSGGLQVSSLDGTFVDVTPIAGTVVVNAGDLLARWSNDTIKSTMHRVVEPLAPADGDVHPARYSIAYFCNPNFDKFIDAIPGTYGGDMGKKKYGGINSGEYLVMRLAATY